jgi:hypothetical protein
MSDSASPALSAPKGRFTPGCLLLMVGGVWLLALGGWFFYSAYRQVQEIRSFADTSAKPLTPAQPTGEELTALRARLSEFSAAVGRKEKAVLKLNEADLNAILSGEEPLSGVKTSVKVTGITPEFVRLSVSLALNGMPFSGERFWINGEAEILPAKRDAKGVFLSTRNLTIPGKSITEGFLHHYKEHGHLDALLLDPYRAEGSAVLDLMKKLTTVRLEAGAVIAEYVPAP